MAFPGGIIPTDENKINPALSFTLLNSSLKQETGTYHYVKESQKDLFRPPIYLNLRGKSIFFVSTHPKCMRFSLFYTYTHIMHPYKHF